MVLHLPPPEIKLLPETRMSFLKAQTAYSDFVNSGNFARDFHSPVIGS